MGAVMIAAAPSLPCVGPTAAACNAAKDVVGDTVAGAADSFMERLVQSTMNGLVEIVGTFGSAMFVVDSPSVGTDNGQASSTLTAVSSSLEWVVLLVGMLAMMAAVIRMFWTLDAGTEGRVIVRMMINVVASSSLVIGMTTLLLRATDEFSLWSLYAISGHSEEDLNTGDKFAKALLGGNIVQDGQMMQGLSLIAILLIVVAAFGSVMQFVWMIVRSPLIIATVAFIPVFAASSGFRTGQERFNKALMFLLACVLYKPVAAILYGLGLRMMQGQGDSNPLMEFMWGTTLLLLVGLAGPAMIKFFVAEASVGTSNAFSGAAGMAAAGAAVYGTAALGATLASGGASAGAGSGTAAAASGGGGAGGGGAVVGTAPLGGGGGGSGGPGGGIGGGGAPSPSTPPSGGQSEGAPGGDIGTPSPSSPPSESETAPGGGSSGTSSITPSTGGSGSSGGPPGSGVNGAAVTAAGPSSTHAVQGQGGGAAAPSGPGSSTAGEQRAAGARAEDPSATPSASATGASGATAPHTTGGARAVGSRARHSAQRAAHVGQRAATASGAAVNDMSESAQAGSPRRG